MKLYSIQNAFAEQNQPSGPHSFVDFLYLLWYALCQQEVKKYGKAYERLKAIAFRLTNVQSPFEINTETLTTNFQNCIRKIYSVYNI